jgi:hypothetical protein
MDPPNLPFMDPEPPIDRSRTIDTPPPLSHIWDLWGAGESAVDRFFRLNPDLLAAIGTGGSRRARRRARRTLKRVRRGMQSLRVPRGTEAEPASSPAT